MSTHLKFDLRTAYEAGATEHPQEVMKKLGITYQDATPQSISDQWWFWNCENIPKKKLKYLSILKKDPMDCIGLGLSKERAIAIKTKTLLHK